MIDNPSDNELAAMDRAYVKTENNSMREEGYTAGKDKKGRELIVDNSPGTSNEHATNDVGYKNFRAAGGVLSGSHQTHTHGAQIKVEANGDVIAAVPNSSPGDRKANKFFSRPEAVLGYSIAISNVTSGDLQKAKNNLGKYIPMSNFCSLQRIVTFYNSSGNLFSGDFEKFKSVVKSINSTPH